MTANMMPAVDTLERTWGLDDTFSKSAISFSSLFLFGKNDLAFGFNGLGQRLFGRTNETTASALTAFHTV